jgi:hypothetical protein
MDGVHPVLTEEAEVAETSDFQGGPDERGQECTLAPCGRERADGRNPQDASGGLR